MLTVMTFQISDQFYDHTKNHVNMINFQGCLQRVFYTQGM